jgi:hypothetical protein
MCPGPSVIMIQFVRIGEKIVCEAVSIILALFYIRYFNSSILGK